MRRQHVDQFGQAYRIASDREGGDQSGRQDRERDAEAGKRGAGHDDFPMSSLRKHSRMHISILIARLRDYVRGARHFTPSPRARGEGGMRGTFRESEPAETPPHRAEFGFS